MPQGPYRHYVLNVIWIFINSLSILLTIYHLHRLYKDYTRWHQQDTDGCWLKCIYILCWTNFLIPFERTLK